MHMNDNECRVFKSDWKFSFLGVFRIFDFLECRFSVLFEDYKQKSLYYKRSWRIMDAQYSNPTQNFHSQGYLNFPVFWNRDFWVYSWTTNENKYITINYKRFWISTTFLYLSPRLGVQDDSLKIHVRHIFELQTKKMVLQTITNIKISKKNFPEFLGQSGCQVHEPLSCNSSNSLALAAKKN